MRSLVPVVMLFFAFLPARVSTAQSDRVIKRAVLSSGLVIEGVAESRAGKPLTEVRVVSVLKGQLTSKTVRVDLQRSPMGLWPRRGGRNIFCLVESSGGKYALSTHHGSLLSPTEDRRSLVRRLAGTLPAPPPTELKTTPSVPTLLSTEQKAAETELAKLVAASDTVLVGSLSGARAVQKKKVYAAASLRVQEALLGLGRYPGPVSVWFPGAPGGGTSPLPEPGRYLLFLKGHEEEGFVLVSVGQGVRRLEDRVAEAKLKGKILRHLAGRRGEVFTTVQATLAAWQTAWNGKKIDDCIRCYSRGNALRKQYESGEAGRVRLKDQIESFPGEVSLRLQRVAVRPEPAGGDPRSAEVTVRLTIAAEGIEEHRTAKMKFVREGREWLILDEGF